MASECNDCKPGFFQNERGKDKCESCPTGGYSDSKDISNGVFTSCPPGTFNGQTGNNSIDACRK